jgi:hypothetical protein
MGWLANALMLTGSYCVGEHHRIGLLMQLAGNALWAYIGIYRYDGKDRRSLIAISVAFCVLYVFNFWKWST